MDLGLSGRWALVCGASQGLGYACAEALAREGVNLVILSRSRGPLEAAAERISAVADVRVIATPGDVTIPADRLAAVSAAPQIDILITNAGGPPPGDFRSFERADWIDALDANMLAPIELIKLVVDPMIERRFGRIVNITSGAVKAPVDVLCLSNGARAGLTGFVAGLARKTVEHNVTINNLLPGAFDTDRLRAVLAKQASALGVTLEAASGNVLSATPARRFGDPDEFGRACAFLCAAGSGYITGQNLLIDGGAFGGVF